MLQATQANSASYTQQGREISSGQTAVWLEVKAEWFIPFVDKRVGGR